MLTTQCKRLCYAIIPCYAIYLICYAICGAKGCFCYAICYAIIPIKIYSAFI